MDYLLWFLRSDERKVLLGLRINRYDLKTWARHGHLDLLKWHAEKQPRHWSLHADEASEDAILCNRINIVVWCPPQSYDSVLRGMRLAAWNCNIDMLNVLYTQPVAKRVNGLQLYNLPRYADSRSEADVHRLLEWVKKVTEERYAPPESKRRKLNA